MKEAIPQKRKVVIVKMSVDLGAAKIVNREKAKIENQEKVKNVVDQGDVVGQVKNVQNVPRTVTETEVTKKDDRDVAKRNDIAEAKNDVQSDGTIDRRSIQHTIVIPIIRRNIEIVHCRQCLSVDHEHHQIPHRQIQRNSSMNSVAVEVLVAVAILKNQ